MILVFVPILFTVFYPTNLFALPAQLTIHRKGIWDEGIVISGEDVVTFATEDVDIHCICITGLWAFYGTHSGKPLIIGGEGDYCTQMNERISKITLLSAPSGEINAHTISVFDRQMSNLNTKLVYKSFEPDSMWETFTDLESVTIITVGNSPFTFTRTKDYCLMPNKTGDTTFYYCIYENDELSKSKGVAHITPLCAENAKILNPSYCVPFYKGEGFCPKLEDQMLSKFGKNDVKRSADQKMLGRVFINGSVAMKNYSFANATTEHPRDFSMSKHVHAGTSNLIRAELWNYVTQAVEKLSGLRPADSSPKYKITAFRLLDLCKKISEVSCPSFYAGNNFFDVAIGTFISLQSKVFKFGETYENFPTERRITLALNKCLKNFTESGPHPFIQRSGPCNETAETGTFEKYGAIDELIMAQNSTGVNWEPIIDTAWQSFLHAHSACYGFFSYYNDHHTFMSIMMPLFTNDVNLLWYRGKLPSGMGALETTDADIYGYAVGYFRDGVTFSSACSAFGRLESEYPWDIARPGRQS